MPRAGVLGWPVAHSRSPAMHRAAYEALGLTDWSYQLLPVPPELFTATARSLGGAGFVGANVTVPHKQAALALAEEASVAAREIGAANTLIYREDGALVAENTDAPGLLASLPHEPRGWSAQVLGAGGSARAVVWALLGAGAASVAVWNRSPARARALAHDLGAEAVERPRAADLLVNCTSVGRRGEGETFKVLPLTADTAGDYACVVDLVYRDGPTELLAAAGERGSAVIDGLEVLVQQGAMSFEMWTGRRAPLDAMRSGARGGSTRQ